MRIFTVLLFVTLAATSAWAVGPNKWTGGGGDGLWTTAANWSYGTVPVSADNVLLDNSTVPGSYTVTIPVSAAAITVKTIQIGYAGNTNTITLYFASSVTPNGFKFGDGASGNLDFDVDQGGVFINASNASGSTYFARAAASDSLRVKSGGKWIQVTAASFTTPFPAANSKFDEGSTFELNVRTGTGTPTVSGRTWGNYVMAGDSAGGSSTYSGASGGGAFTVLDTWTVKSGVTLSGWTTTGTHTVNNIVFNGSMSYGTASGSLSITGNVTVNGTWTTSATLPITCNGTAAQAIGGSTAITFNDGLTISNAAGVTLSQSATVNGALTISSGATLTLSGSLLTLNGDLVNNGGTLGGSGGVTIAGTATQSIGSFSISGDVSMTKTSGTATLTGGYINGNGLIINGSGGTLNIGSGTHDFTGGWTRTAGTVDGGTLGGTLIFGGSVSGTGGTFIGGTSTVEWNANGPQTIAGIEYNNLQLRGSGVKTVTGATVDARFALAGTATVSGTVTYGASSSLHYEGDAQQTTGTELPASMVQPVTINNSHGVVLGGSTALNGTGTMLTITSGNLTTGGYTLTLGPTATVSGEASGQYVVGNLVKTEAVSTGASSSLNTIGVALNAGGDNLGTVTVTRVSGSAGAITALGHTGINRSWTITSDNAPTAGRTLTLSWVSDDDNGKSLSSMEIFKSTNGGTTWFATGGIHDVSGSDPRSLSVSTTSFSKWTVSSTDYSLPVQATDFLAAADVGSVTISWKTQTEVDNAGFNVLRQDPPQAGQAGMGTFKLVSSYTSNDNLKGLGTSSSGRAYSFVDKHVVSGATYQYQIQSVSTSGATANVGTVLQVTTSLPKDYALYQNYPNPFNPSTTVQFDLKEGSTVILGIYNVLGQKVQEWNLGSMNAGRYYQNINMDKYASGVYYYRIDVTGNSAQGGSASGGDGQKFNSIKKLVLMK